MDIALGVARGLLDTHVRFDAVERHGVKADGSATAAGARVPTTLADLVSENRLEVRETCHLLEGALHIRGKVVPTQA